MSAIKSKTEKQIDDGGPAFATLLSRRDWLAGLAMQGMLAHDATRTEVMIAEWAYSQADAMIEEGKKQ